MTTDRADARAAQRGGRVLVGIGTRPEAIKLAPVIFGLRRIPGIDVVVLATGQHRDQLDSALAAFAITPDADLDVMTDRQALPDVVARITPAAGETIRRVQPRMLVVQGDTISAFCLSFAAFLEGVPVAHVEAGLRSGVLREPFPEEASRRLTDVVSDLDLAPTPAARDNLLAEGIRPDRIVVTGQTAVDALLMTAKTAQLPESLRGRRLVTVTMHRRESWAVLDRLANALRTLASRHPELTFVYPMHRNPVVREAVVPALGDVPNFVLDEPFDYGPMVALMATSELIITDSGGILEEGVTLGTHVAVLRNVTERPEGIDAGLASLVGNDPDAALEAVERLLAEPPKRRETPNPYGDGLAGERAAQAIAWSIGMGERPTDWR